MTRTGTALGIAAAALLGDSFAPWWDLSGTNASEQLWAGPSLGVVLLFAVLAAGWLGTGAAGRRPRSAAWLVGALVLVVGVVSAVRWPAATPSLPRRVADYSPTPSTGFAHTHTLGAGAYAGLALTAVITALLRRLRNRPTETARLPVTGAVAALVVAAGFLPWQDSFFGPGEVGFFSSSPLPPSLPPPRHLTGWQSSDLVVLALVLGLGAVALAPWAGHGRAIPRPAPALLCVAAAALALGALLTGGRVPGTWLAGAYTAPLYLGLLAAALGSRSLRRRAARTRT